MYLFKDDFLPFSTLKGLKANRSSSSGDHPYSAPFLAKRNRGERWEVSGPGQQMHRENLGRLVIQKARELLATNGLC